MLPRVADLKVVKLAPFEDARGTLTAIDLPGVVDFPVRRIFWISGVPADGVRGQHAHKVCNQFMICQVGRVSVEASDAQSLRHLELAAGTAVFIPAGIYAAERFEQPGSVLAVLCDQPYDRGDYIYDLAELAAFRSAAERK